MLIASPIIADVKVQVESVVKTLLPAAIDNTGVQLCASATG